MDVDPDRGEYRLSAVVPAVEINTLRASMGARPIPNPVAGSAEGLIHCTGPLREPIFTGTFESIYFNNLIN